MKQRIKKTFLLLLVLLTGVIIGGYLFSESRPRSFLTLNKCNATCLNKNELLGLMASVGIQKFEGLVPYVITETDKTIVLQHPSPQAKIHYVIIPKKDIKDVGSLTKEDQPYVIDMMQTIAIIVKEQNLKRYKVVTNGPGYQHVTYLHFHLLAKD